MILQHWFHKLVAFLVGYAIKYTLVFFVSYSLSGIGLSRYKIPYLHSDFICTILVNDVYRMNFHTMTVLVPPLKLGVNDAVLLTKANNRQLAFDS